MRKMIANAMLCLLLLLSMASARCESLCAVSSMPATAMTTTQDNAMAMTSDMGHCHGMQGMQNGLPNADAACGQMNCRHQALPASSDFRVVTDDAVSLTAVMLPVVERLILPVQRVDEAADSPRFVALTPFEQSSMLRV